jgi:hypothetical protein
MRIFFEMLFLCLSIFALQKKLTFLYGFFEQFLQGPSDSPLVDPFQMELEPFRQF